MTSLVTQGIRDARWRIAYARCADREFSQLKGYSLYEAFPPDHYLGPRHTGHGWRRYVYADGVLQFCNGAHNLSIERHLLGPRDTQRPWLIVRRVAERTQVLGSYPTLKSAKVAYYMKL